jgi:hypothetical protein
LGRLWPDEGLTVWPLERVDDRAGDRVAEDLEEEALPLELRREAEDDLLVDEEERTVLPDRVGEEARPDEALEEVDFPEVRSILLCAWTEGADKRNPNIIPKINRLNLRMALPPKGGGVETLKWGVQIPVHLPRADGMGNTISKNGRMNTHSIIHSSNEL